MVTFRIFFLNAKKEIWWTKIDKIIDVYKLKSVKTNFKFEICYLRMEEQFYGFALAPLS